MAQATSNLLMLIPVLCCCCVLGGDVTAAESWCGGHPQYSPRAQAAALSLPKAEWFSQEDVLKQPNEINHWILALALQIWPELSTSLPVWKGQWCKCCGREGLTCFRGLHSLSLYNSEALGIKRPWMHHSLLALLNVTICVCIWMDWTGTCVSYVILALWV